MIRTPIALGAGACLVLATLTPAAEAAPKQPALKLISTVGSVAAYNYIAPPNAPEAASGFYLDLGTYVTAVGKPFEVRVKRPSYGEKLEAVQIVGGKTRKLAAGTVQDWSGLAGFFKIKLTDSTGKVARSYSQTWCPANQGSRVVPSGAPKNRYPEGCPRNGFTLGAVWGIQAGWGSNTASYNPLPMIKDGKYVAEISIAPKYQKLFGASAASKKIKVTVTTVKDEGDEGQGRKRPAPQAAAARPKGKPKVPKGPKPDLRSLPAWDIAISKPDDAAPEPTMSPMPGMRVAPAPAKKDYLQFSADVWNAGPSPLVVDGFRRQGKGIMDAYQYFFDTHGKQVGYTKSGTFEWDPRAGHEHWHFTDFAAYRLLGADKKLIVRSQKEAFCLASTDAIDYTVKGANWFPDGTDLHTSCGNATSLSVREVLDVGSGDTYVQTLPGQSFDVTNLPNGVYYIQVAANPKGRLFEGNTKNNVSLRKVILGGKPGARTVQVPKVGLVDQK